MQAFKKIILLILTLILIHFKVVCQHPSDILNITIDNNQVCIGYDSINKNQNAAYQAGIEDAKEFYSSNRAFTVSFLTTLLLPPVGLITTTVISLKNPTIEILDLPNKKLLKNENYTNGYIHKAKRMNAVKAWGGCITAIGFLGAGYFMFYGLN